MKKVIIILAAVSAAVSCMKDGKSFEASFTLNETFDGYSNESELFPDGKDVLFSENGALGSNYMLYHSEGTEESLDGGFALSRQAWEFPDKDEDGGENGEEPENPADPDPYKVPYGVFGTPGQGGAPMNGVSASSKTFMYFRQSGMMPEHAISFATPDVGTCTMIGMMVNNSAYTVYNIVGSDSTEFNLAGDLNLKVTGYKNGLETKTVTVLLAGKGKGKETSDGSQRDSLITRWTAIDLSELGSIDCIDMKIEGDVPGMGYNDVCIDNFSASIHIAY